LVRVRIRVLMAIGPRSGLWYLDKKVTSWMFGSFFDGFWRSQFIAAVTFWGFWKQPPYKVLRWVKNDEEPTILEAIHSFKRELSHLSRYLGVLVRIPWTYVPNWQSWEDGEIRLQGTRSEWPIVHPLMNFMYFYIALCVPVIPNLFVRLLLQLQKVITGLVLIIRWRSLEFFRIITVRKETDLRWCLVVLSFLLCSSWVEMVCCTIFIVSLHEFMYSYWFSTFIRKQIHSTRGYSYWPAYDPMASSVTTLEKVADKVKLEDSGAYTSLIRMSSGVPFVNKYLRNRDNSLSKRKKVVTKISRCSNRGGVITPPTPVTKV
jgi:hypothetical protein